MRVKEQSGKSKEQSGTEPRLKSSLPSSGELRVASCEFGGFAVWPPHSNYHRTTWTSPALKRFYERTGKNPAINTAQELYYLSEYREEILAIEREIAEEERRGKVEGRSWKLEGRSWKLEGRSGKLEGRREARHE